MKTAIRVTIAALFLIASLYIFTSIATAVKLHGGRIDTAYHNGGKV